VTSVLCLVETDDDGIVEASRRALTVARRLADSDGSTLGAALVSSRPEAVVGELGAYGVADAHAITLNGVTAFAPMAWARALLELAASTEASAVVAGGTDRGNEVLAYAGAFSAEPMVANCVDAARTSTETVAVTRQRWAGSLIEESVLTASRALFTVAFDGVTAEPAPGSVATNVLDVAYDVDLVDRAVEVAEWTRRSGGVALAEARVVVGGGRGVGSAEGFAPIDELAELLGAAVGVSRVVTSLGWRPHAQQVGQTGTRITPELYLACGISGATQHLAGCQSAKYVVAINTDADAPIVARADYAVIGDLNEIIPALVEAIRSR